MPKDTRASVTEIRAGSGYVKRPIAADRAAHEQQGGGVTKCLTGAKCRVKHPGLVQCPFEKRVILP